MGHGRAHLLRIEGANFTATLYDTNDISTIRGAGLALLEAADAVKNCLVEQAGLADLRQIFAGASQAGFAFVADEAAAEAALAAVRRLLADTGVPPLCRLMFVVDLAPLAGDEIHEIETALRVAESRNRAGQFRSFTIKQPDPKTASPGPDPFDHVSQATRKYGMQGGEALMRAPTVVDRHDYGRDQRSAFYRRADGRPLRTCASVQDMIHDPPPGLPVSVRGKVGYLYADGNRFGAIQARIGTEVFAAALAPLQTTMLHRITRWLRDGLAAEDKARAAPIGAESHARFETLLWGGDEFLFVMPGWLALPILGELVIAMQGWRIGEEDLTFAFGLVICDVKAPVRQARDTAHALAETVKDALGGAARSGAAIQVYESQSLVDSPLAIQRSLAFGLPHSQIDELAPKLVIAAEALPGLPGRIRHLTEDGVADGALSASLLHAALMAARSASGGLLSAAGEDAARETLEAAFKRFGQTIPGMTIAGFYERGLVLDLCLLAMLRDYCASPWAGPPPNFPVLPS